MLINMNIEVGVTEIVVIICAVVLVTLVAIFL